MGSRGVVFFLVLTGCGSSGSLEGQVAGQRPFTVTSALWLGRDTVVLSDAPDPKQECVAFEQRETNSTASLMLNGVSLINDSVRLVQPESELRAGLWSRSGTASAWYMTKDGNHAEWDGGIVTVSRTDTVLTGKLELTGASGDRLTGEFSAERCKPLPSDL